MYCPNCGMEIDDNSKFCSTCGEKITDALNDMGIRYKNGDQSAFQEIYDDTVFWVRSYVYNRVSVSNVEDCMQSIYIKLFEHISKFDENKGPFRAWFNTLVANETIDFLRKYEKTQSKNVDSLYDEEDKVIDIVDPGMSPEDVMEKQEVARIMSEILSEISEEQRQCIMLRYMEGLKNKEIADIMGISEGTVKSRISYGLKRVEAKVVELEKQGTKLYSMAPLPFFLWIICRGNVAGLTISGNLWTNVATSTVGLSSSAVTGVSATVGAGTATGGTTTVASGMTKAGVAAGATGLVSVGVKGLMLKILLGISLGAVIVGGGIGIKHLVEKAKNAEIETETSIGKPTTEEVATATDADAVIIGDATATDVVVAEYPEWIDAYVEDLEKKVENGESYLDLGLIDIDGDDVPEMFLTVPAGNGGGYLYTYMDDQVVAVNDREFMDWLYINNENNSGFMEPGRNWVGQAYEFTIFNVENNKIRYEYDVIFGGYGDDKESCFKKEYIDGVVGEPVSISYEEAKALMSDYVEIEDYYTEDVGGGEIGQFLEYTVKDGMTTPYTYSFEYGEDIDYEALREWMMEYYRSMNGLSDDSDTEQAGAKSDITVEYQPLMEEFYNTLLSDEITFSYNGEVGAFESGTVIGGSYEGRCKDFGYCFKDINSDGVIELLITKSGYLHIVYTLDQGEPKLVVSNWDRGVRVLWENGAIYCYNNEGGAGIESYTLREPINGSWEITKYYFSERIYESDDPLADYTIKYFYQPEPQNGRDVSTAIEISEEELQEFCNSGTAMEFDTISFEEYGE